jgi:hypothetical protein
MASAPIGGKRERVAINTLSGADFEWVHDALDGSFLPWKTLYLFIVFLRTAPRDEVHCNLLFLFEVLVGAQGLEPWTR